jgi:hypothetical protein
VPSRPRKRWLIRPCASDLEVAHIFVQLQAVSQSLQPVPTGDCFAFIWVHR